MNETRFGMFWGGCFFSCFFVGELVHAGSVRRKVQGSYRFTTFFWGDKQVLADWRVMLPSQDLSNEDLN